jgi:phage terminase large subunit GpA-like protein
LSPEASAEPGRWYTDRAEYQRGIMDAFSDSSVEEVVVMSSAQVGKTEILLNVCAFFIDQDPAPQLLVQPTLEMGEAFSKDRLAPMLRDTPCLQGKVKDPRSRDSGNTLLHKNFPGGHLTIAGSNSPASLASRPIRVVLQDEVDRYPASAGAEGDPCSLADARSKNFWNRKKGKFSTPTVRGSSRIELAYEASDKRRYFVCCHECGAAQVLTWNQVKWDEDPASPWYECQACAARWSDADRFKAIRKGEWRATAQFNGVAGFHLSALYSPWTPLRELVRDWIRAQKSPELLKTFINTALGETWEERGDVTVDAHALMERCEEFEDELPAQVAVITAGVDVQADRLEVEIVGWGADEESWSLGYHVLSGDTARPEVWEDLESLLVSEYTHPKGITLKPRAVCVDSGYRDSMVLRFTRDKYSRRVFAVKGRTDGSIWPRKPSRKNQTPFFNVGTSAAKDAISGFIRLSDPGPGCMHFPVGRDLEYFEQLTAERKVTKYVHGFAKREWRKQDGQRNEALDCRVYAYAALHALYSLGFKLNAEAERVSALQPPPKVQVPAPVVQSVGGGWLGNRGRDWFTR